MDDFYFAVGSDPRDVFIVVNGKWIHYKRCETEEIAQALVTGQNESRKYNNADCNYCQDEIFHVVDVTGVCRFEEREEAKNGKQS